MCVHKFVSIWSIPHLRFFRIEPNEVEHLHNVGVYMGELCHCTKFRLEVQWALWCQDWDWSRSLQKRIIPSKELLNHGVLSAIIYTLEPFNRISFHILASNGRYMMWISINGLIICTKDMSNYPQIGKGWFMYNK
jgi:hypothetical protein